MPKQITPLLGKKWTAYPVIKKFLDKHPELLISEIETLPLIEAATRRDFFLKPKGNAEGIRDFGRLYFRHPVETIELLALIQKHMADNFFHTVRIERYFDLKGMRKSDAKIAKDLNAEARQRHGDNYASVEGTVTKDEVRQERRKMIKERADFIPGQTAARQQFIRDGIINTPKKKPSRGKI